MPAGVAELADALDLGSSGKPWGFKSLLPHQYSVNFKKCAGGFKRKWLSGRASPCQGEGRGFESRLPLQLVYKASLN
jgi:hypothetical protein